MMRALVFFGAGSHDVTTFATCFAVIFPSGAVLTTSAHAFGWSFSSSRASACAWLSVRRTGSFDKFVKRRSTWAVVNCRYISRSLCGNSAVTHTRQLSYPRAAQPLRSCNSRTNERTSDPLRAPCGNFLPETAGPRHSQKTDGRKRAGTTFSATTTLVDSSLTVAAHETFSLRRRSRIAAKSAISTAQVGPGGRTNRAFSARTSLYEPAAVHESSRPVRPRCLSYGLGPVPGTKASYRASSYEQTGVSGTGVDGRLGRAR